MPMSHSEQQKRFKLTLYDGQPEGVVEATQGARMVMCCPLCGCIHQVMGVDMSKPYTPLCQSNPPMFKLQVSAWQKRFPEVVTFKSIHLVGAIN